MTRNKYRVFSGDPRYRRLSSGCNSFDTVTRARAGVDLSIDLEQIRRLFEKRVTLSFLQQ